MQNPLQSMATVAGRVMLSTIFLMSALGNKIPNFTSVSEYMASEGVPAPKFMLFGAIVFLIVGSLSVILGFKARVGAGLLFVFLLLATFFFHDFWTLDDPQQQQMQTIQFMKNLSMMGAMLFIMANGSGPLSLDAKLAGETKESVALKTTVAA